MSDVRLSPQANPDGGRRLAGIPGTLAPDAPGLSAGNLNPPANRLYLARFVPSRNMVITQLRHVITTAASADDQCDLGILDAQGNRLVSTGAQAGKLIGATGIKTSNIAATPLARDTPYFAAFAYGAIGGASSALMAALQAVAFGLAGLFEAVPNTVDSRVSYAVKDATFPIPAAVALNTWTLTGGGIPVVALME